MQRIIAFFLALLLSVSVGLGAAAHAMEPTASIDTTEASLFGHSVGDSDEVPADADKGYPHHHGACHDHGIGVPATAERLPLHEHIVQAPASNRRGEPRYSRSGFAPPPTKGLTHRYRRRS